MRIQRKLNVSTQILLLFFTPYDAHASSACSALIVCPADISVRWEKLAISVAASGRTFPLEVRLINKKVPPISFKACVKGNIIFPRKENYFLKE